MNDVLSLINHNDTLCHWEGVAPAVWDDMYKVFAWLQRGVPPVMMHFFQRLANKAMHQFAKHYRPGAVRTYEHLIVYHDVAQQKIHGHPLGEYANQLAEQSHHFHKVDTRDHTMLNGGRRVNDKVVFTQACHEVLVRDWMKKKFTVQLPRIPVKHPYKRHSLSLKRPPIKEFKFTVSALVSSVASDPLITTQ